MLRSLHRVAAVAAVLVSASVASAGSVGPVSTWNVGKGQPNDNFQVVTARFSDRTVELGLRAQLRYLGSIAPVKSTYFVQPGPDATSPANARWNYDFSILSKGGPPLASLYKLALEITSTNSNKPVYEIADLREYLVRYDPTATGLQDSVNPNFSYAFGSGFDFNLPGTYSFKLTAVNLDTAGKLETVSTSMYVTVTVVPTPVALPGGLALLGGLAAFRRRRA